MFSLKEFKALSPARKAIIEKLMASRLYPSGSAFKQQDLNDVLDLWHSSLDGSCVPTGYEDELEANIIRKFAAPCNIALDLAVERFSGFRVRGMVTVEPSYEDNTLVVYHDLFLPFCYGVLSHTAWHFNFATLVDLCEFVEDQRDELLLIFANLVYNCKIGKLKSI